MPFKKGESGNPGGRKGEKIMRDALILALHREAKGCDGKPTKRLHLVADALVQKAQDGDVSAIREIYDRIEGKAEATTNLNIKRDARDYTDSELAAILAESIASRDGTEGETEGEGESSRLH